MNKLKTLPFIRTCTIYLLSLSPALVKSIFCKSGLKHDIDWSFDKQKNLTLSQKTSYTFFQTERGCRNNFRFDENGRKFSKRVENTMCFQKICTAKVWERVTDSEKFWQMTA